MKNPIAKLDPIDQENLVRGKKYLKVLLRIIKRDHDGYCSGLDFTSDQDEEDYIERNTTVETRYYTVPNEVQEETTEELKEGTYNSEGDVEPDNEDVACLFEFWRQASDCKGGCGCCGLYDTYIPLKVEYVFIV